MMGQVAADLAYGYESVPNIFMAFQQAFYVECFSVKKITALYRRHKNFIRFGYIFNNNTQVCIGHGNCYKSSVGRGNL